MNAVSSFADEMTKLAFHLEAPPVLTSLLGKTTEGVIAKPQTAALKPMVKTPLVKTPRAIPTAGGLGTKINPAKAEVPPPAVHGGTNVR